MKTLLVQSIATESIKLLCLAKILSGRKIHLNS